jgi:hypothetical protein
MESALVPLDCFAALAMTPPLLPRRLDVLPDFYERRPVGVGESAGDRAIFASLVQEIVDQLGCRAAARFKTTQKLY